MTKPRPPPVPVPSQQVIILDDPVHGVRYTHRKRVREDLKVILNDMRWQWLIIALVILDACLVCSDIILASTFCGEDHVPHSVHTAEIALRSASIIILSFFVLEWIVEAFVHGVRRWARSPIHLIDLIIVCVSLTLEIVASILSDSKVEVASLLVVFRLWRVVRVMHAVSDVQHHVKDDAKLSLQRQVNKLLSIQDAHHAVIKEMHREYTERLLQMRKASALDGDDVAMAMADDWLDGDTKADGAPPRKQPGAAAKADMVPEAKGGQPPTLEEIMASVCRRSAHTRHAVALHLDSVHDRAKMLGMSDTAGHKMPALIVNAGPEAVRRANGNAQPANGRDDNGAASDDFTDATSGTDDAPHPGEAQ